MNFISLIVWFVITQQVRSERNVCSKFRRFKRYFDKQYKHEEHEAESEAFYQANCDHIEEHRGLYEMGIVPYTLKAMPFIDQDLDVVKSQLCGLRIPPTSRSLPAPTEDIFPPAPPSKNWCYLHTEVRDQLTCGACWAFSAVAALEAATNRVRGSKVHLSEQMLIDCNLQNRACDGGWPTDAFSFAKKNGISINDYIYQNEQQTCGIKNYTKGLEKKAIQKITEVYLEGDEDKLMRMVAAKGPIVVAINIENEMLSYGGGVYLNDLCPKDDCNHAVVVCGYGDDEAYGPYWIVRNSWSELWGEQGYVRIARGRNTCGIASYAMFAEL